MAESAAGSIIKKILIAFAVVFVLLALFYFVVAVPQLIKLKISANETSAIQSLRTIYMAEVSYNATYPDIGFACSLKTLSDPPASLIDSALGEGSKAGYTFNIADCTKITVRNKSYYNGFKLTAVPQVLGKTGTRGFCVDENNAVKIDPSGGTNCTEPLQ